MGTIAERETAAPLPTISVVIPHFNDLAALRLCCERLAAQDWPQSAIEIVVADNNSACGLDAVAATVPRALVVAAPVQGAGPARNAGVAASRGSIIAFLDSDCVAEPDWLSQGVSALRSFDFIGGQVVTFSRDPQRPNAIEAFERVFNFNFQRYIEKVGFTGTGNMFVRRSVFDRVGGFRVGVSEDVDWSFRARALGYRLGYAERAIVGHPARTTWRELARRWERLIAEQFRLANEQRYGRILFALKALMMPLSVFPHSAKVLFSPRLPGPRARLGAIWVLVRLRLWRAARMLRWVLSTSATGSGMVDTEPRASG